MMKKIAAAVLSAGVLSGVAVTMNATSANANGVGRQQGCNVWVYRTTEPTSLFRYEHGTMRPPHHTYLYKGTKVLANKPFGSHPRTTVFASQFGKGWWGLGYGNKYPYIAKSAVSYVGCYYSR